MDAAQRVRRLVDEAPIYREDYWHNMAALTWDVWPRAGGWRERLVRWAHPGLAAVLDAQREAESRHLARR